MRIIAGLAKGLNLKAVKGLSVRPTTDRVKESVFNILANMRVERYREDGGEVSESAIVRQKVLDIFAGTGALGLEALSRGARSAVFIEKSRESLAVIAQNIAAAKMPHLCEVMKCDAFTALERLAKSARSFNLVFADPPYDEGLAAKIADFFDRNSLLEYGGILVLEHSKSEKIDAARNTLTLIRSQKYGQTIVSFFLRNKS